MTIKHLGWNKSWEQSYAIHSIHNGVPGRVISEHKGMYSVWTEKGVWLSEVSGKFRHNSGSRVDFPAVGDWVVLQERKNEQKGIIHKVMERKSKFSRKVAGETTEEQIVATNVDTVFIVVALNQDFNLRRIERYLVTAWDSGANPVVILSKSDLCNDREEKVCQLENIAFGVPFHIISCYQREGIESLYKYIEDGQTVALLGSSGAGKSTLINCMIGKDVQKVKEIREEDDKGKHTTTHRELFILPNGGCLIDTPGMRELQLWDIDQQSNNTFSDIETLAENCRFRDCSHNEEPGCAIQEAIKLKQLDEKRLISYKKLKKELAYIARKNDKRAQLLEKSKWKKSAGDRTRFNR